MIEYLITSIVYHISLDVHVMRLCDTMICKKIKIVSLIWILDIKTIQSMPFNQIKTLKI